MLLMKKNVDRLRPGRATKGADMFLNKNTANFLLLLPFLFLMVLFLSCGNSKTSDQAKAQGSAALSKVFQQILRLNMQYRDGRFSILSGRKSFANPTPLTQITGQAPLLVQTWSKTGEMLFSGGIHDPRLAQLDIEDPRQPGVWEHADIQLSEVFFQLKVPFEEDLSELRIIDNNTTKEISRLNLDSYLENEKR